ncbi:MAG TPA: outer membrane beta-barrel protein [Terriglobales bacterium]|nr:outer membrane beta-barrel protein [Terriglobales bacterium]
MDSKNYVHKSAAGTGKRAAFIAVAAVILTLPLHGQQTANDAPAGASGSANQQASAASQQRQQEIVQELDAMKKRIAQLEAALKQHEAAEQPTTVVDTAKASTPVLPPTAAVANAAPPEAENLLPQTASPEKPAKAEPFAFADWTWLNGNARTKTPAFDSKFFTPEIRADIDYVYDLNHPKDDTIGGSSEVFRSNEVHVTQLGVGGDFHYDNVRARLMTQFGLYSVTTPRNDASPARGQWDLANAYRYVSEAYGGYHFNALHGINVDAGIFMSYVGLFSYYNFDNWAYQPSYVSSNTPWFFNGVRVQIFPTAHLKIEPWFVNGWQAYGRFNNRPGIGGQILWRPNGWLSILGNQYALGEDALNTPGRVRYHTDDSIEVKYYDHPERMLSKAAFSLTGDLGCEHGGGVSCYGNSAKGPKQDFLGFMLYNRLWFHKDLYGFTLGGGKINNPGRYLVLLPPINGATATSGTPYFTENPGDPYKAWDASATFDYMPSQYITFRWEFDHRAASVPYFSGKNGITPPGGNTGAPGSLVTGFTPDLVRDENRLDLSILVKF